MSGSIRFQKETRNERSNTSFRTNYRKRDVKKQLDVLYIVIVEFEKAFDNMGWNKPVFLLMLKNSELKYIDGRIIVKSKD